MSHNLNIDKLDIQIMSEMSRNAGISYAELGKKLFISGGTIHVRMKKLQNMGIIKGTKLSVDLRMLGYEITAFIGIFTEKNSVYEHIVKQLLKIPGVVRLNSTTGVYSMIAELVCKNNTALRDILHAVQQVKGIDRTDTLISLDESFSRSIELEL
ncbi:winged helix-turn-helix transcriptional regulator [Chitinophaga defluvii]|uniref:Winged helix-turn-helix transcriptional regulator n=1 Tax=Chitinophaga defluvii TaxID=3163343 RepID=A0ABV2TBN1_9BACT